MGSIEGNKIGKKKKKKKKKKGRVFIKPICCKCALAFREWILPTVNEYPSAAQVQWGGLDQAYFI